MNKKVLPPPYEILATDRSFEIVKYAAYELSEASPFVLATIPLTHSNSEEIARFVLNALNSHAALLDALESLLKICETIAPYLYCEFGSTPLKAKDAIALAKGES